jgi:hypothetical protein
MSGSNAQAKDQQRQKAQLKQLLAAGKAQFKGDEVFSNQGRRLTPAQLLAELEAMLQPHLDLDAAVAKARTMLGDARATVRKTLPKGRAYLSNVRTSIRSWYGKGNPILKSFGVPTGLRRPLTAAEKLEAVGSRLLTRKARKTMGKRQRQAIKGGQATVTVTGPDGKPVPAGKKGRK